MRRHSHGEHQTCDGPCCLTLTAGGITGAVVTLIAFADFAFLRQRFCTTICPYGYLQGMLGDKNTLLVHYRDDKHGCIECKKCVRICVAEVLDMSRRTLRAVKQNLCWAFTYNVIGLAIAAAGLLNPILASGAMVVSSLCVTANALRLGRGRAAGRGALRVACEPQPSHSLQSRAGAV